MVSWYKAAASLLPWTGDATRQCDAAEAGGPAVSSASVVAALLAVHCVALLLRIIQLQRQLAVRRQPSTKTAVFSDAWDRPFWASSQHHRDSPTSTATPSAANAATVQLPGSRPEDPIELD